MMLQTRTFNFRSLLSDFDSRLLVAVIVVRVMSMLFYTFQGFCKLRFNSLIGWEFEILMWIKVYHYQMLLNQRLNIFILISGLADQKLSV